MSNGKNRKLKLRFANVILIDLRTKVQPDEFVGVLYSQNTDNVAFALITDTGETSAYYYDFDEHAGKHAKSEAARVLDELYNRVTDEPPPAAKPEKPAWAE